MFCDEYDNISVTHIYIQKIRTNIFVHPLNTLTAFYI